jgi:peptidoglycan/LPS O-acetylase OafA/YrhL
MSEGGTARAGRPAYRPDIDGLRAVAVAGVVLAHAGVPFLQAGILGVDVFFVISGYLIASILAGELAAGGIQFARFYERRARRILPALVLVVACCVPFALWLMLPWALRSFGQETFATMAFSNNLKLALTADYWDLQSAQKPLLHTWSLGVEEQFYLVFPLYLALAVRFGRRAAVIAIANAGIGSFALCELSWRLIGSVNFYLPTSRAWELMAGCALAYVPRRPRRFDGPVAAAGLAAIVFSMVLLGEVESPSAWCLPAVLGTAALILCNRPEHATCKLLSLRPVVFVGLISYSVYLWHQPLFAFARIARIDPPPPLEMAALVLLTLALATLSWRLVERPFRNPAAVPRRRFFALSVPAVAGLAALGLVFHFAQGFPRWTYPNLRDPADISKAYNERIRGIGHGPFPANGRANVLVVGNSFARDISNVLIESGALKDRNLVYLHAEGACPAPSQSVPEDVAALAAADVVVIVLSGHAAQCAEPARADLARRTGVPTVFVGSKYFGESINPFGRVPLARRREALADGGADLAAENRAIARAIPAGRFVDLMRVLGPDGRHARFFDDDGNPITPDRLHLTRYGAQYVARRLQEEHSPLLTLIAGARHRDR